MLNELYEKYHTPLIFKLENPRHPIRLLVITVQTTLLSLLSYTRETQSQGSHHLIPSCTSLSPSWRSLRNQPSIHSTIYSSTWTPSPTTSSRRCSIGSHRSSRKSQISVPEYSKIRETRLRWLSRILSMQN